jgi:hypothetical protein
MKSTILLTTALFLASAPSPDSKVISEISAGFFSLTDTHGLMASDTPLNGRFNSNSSAPTSALLKTAEYKQSNTPKTVD